jgi:hypothetical protein
MWELPVIEIRSFRPLRLIRRNDAIKVVSHGSEGQSPPCLHSHALVARGGPACNIKGVGRLAACWLASFLEEKLHAASD